jgi:hypothetical protein
MASDMDGGANVGEELMSHSELSRNVRKHRRDLYEWDGPENPPITHRLATLEEHNRTVADDLYDKKTGLVPLLRSFFAVLEEREKAKSNQLARYMAMIAIAALLSPILWDTAKHIFGWFK